MSLKKRLFVAICGVTLAPMGLTVFLPTLKACAQAK